MLNIKTTKNMLVPVHSIQNATVARIRAAYGKRLLQDDYNALIGMKNVGEVADYLKKNPRFSEVFTDVEPTTMHRGFLETLLYKHLYEQGVAWCKFQNLETERFFKYRLEDRETREIMNALMHLSTGVPENYIESLPSYLIKSASFDLLQFARVRDYSQFLSVIKGTSYYNVLKDVPVKISQAKNGESGVETIDYTRCEIAIRKHYIERLLSAVNSDFKGEERKNLLSQIKVQSDIVNITNIYRMKHYFNMPADEIEKYMIPTKGRLTQAFKDQLKAVKTDEEFFSLLATTSYGKLLNDMPEVTSLYFEYRLKKLRCEMAYRALMFSRSAAISVYSALYLLEIEIENLVTIIESIRYGKPASYMEKLILVI